MLPYQPAEETRWLNPWLGQGTPAQAPHPPVVQSERVSSESRDKPLPPGYVIPATAAALAVSTAGAWIGIRSGIREDGLASLAGWATGVTSILIGLAVLASLADPARTPKVLLLPFRLDVRS
jgi:hypothetical protein